MTALEQICAQIGPDLPSATRVRIREHVLAQLVCMENHTITGLISTCGRQFEDWSADYRMYAHSRVTPERLFDPVRRWVAQHQTGPVVIAMDDTRLRKSGRKVYGANYTRAPMSPPFHVNFIRAQRFLQISMAWPSGTGAARMIPADWLHAPLPAKPKRNEGPEAWEDFRHAARKARISLVGGQRLEHMRQWLNQNDGEHRRLWAVVDGSFTNATVIKTLPANTTLMGRIRRDAKSYRLPCPQDSGGRPRSYGERY